MNQNTLILDQYSLDYEKLESRSLGPNKDKAGLFYSGQPMTVDSAHGAKAAKRQELFVSSMGETGANELKFFNLNGDSRDHHPHCLKRVELTIDGCNYLSVHSKMHFTILMASNNGSVFAWMSRPGKII